MTLLDLQDHLQIVSSPPEYVKRVKVPPPRYNAQVSIQNSTFSPIRRKSKKTPIIHSHASLSPGVEVNRNGSDFSTETISVEVKELHQGGKKSKKRKHGHPRPKTKSKHRMLSSEQRGSGNLRLRLPGGASQQHVAATQSMDYGRSNSQPDSSLTRASTLTVVERPLTSWTVTPPGSLSHGGSGSLPDALSHLRISQAGAGLSQRRPNHTQQQPVPVKVTSTSHTDKPRKVFLSERQSENLRELGREFPCAPPATPQPAPSSSKEYVPSMGDLRAQRQVKMRLDSLGAAQQASERRRDEKAREARLRDERGAAKEQERKAKRRQRQQIYALNKVMTALELDGFRQFCSANGIPCSE